MHLGKPEMTNFWCGRFYYTLCTSNLGMWRAACVSRSPMSVATRTMIYIYCWLLWQIASFTRVLIQNHQPTFYDHKTELYAEALRMANLRILISSRSGPTGRLRSHLSQNGGESESRVRVVRLTVNCAIKRWFCNHGLPCYSSSSDNISLFLYLYK